MGNKKCIDEPNVYYYCLEKMETIINEMEQSV